MKFLQVTPALRSQVQPGIVAIEKTAIYPLGKDSFQIDHGANYFAFFDRLGTVHYSVAMQGDRVAAVGAGVLRQVPYRQAEAPRPAWYLCDLKVHSNYQRQNLSLRLLSHALQADLPLCRQGYAISMNPGDASSNRLVRVLERFTPLKLRYSTTLGIYSLEADAMQQLQPLLAEHRGQLSYLSLKGIKDLRLSSNGQILPLLHLQWGATAELGMLAPQPGYTHMFCLPAQDPLTTVLAKRGICPTATASVVSQGMEHSDWGFILTSDI